MGDVNLYIRRFDSNSSSFQLSYMYSYNKQTENYMAHGRIPSTLIDTLTYSCITPAVENV